MKDVILQRPPVHTDLHCAGHVLQAASNKTSESRWKVVADKLGETEGRGGLAALLLGLNKGNSGSLPVALPAIVTPASSSLSSQK